MVEAPELTSITRPRGIQPLMAAWALVFVALAAVFIWLSLSADIAPAPGQVPDETAAGNEIALAHNIPPAARKTGDEATGPATGQMERIALVKAPIDGLVITGANGPLPVLGPDSMVAWKEYARPVKNPESGDNDPNSGPSSAKPLIAIIITGIGLNSKTADLAIKKLPGQIDLAFSPYGRQLQQWMDKARQYGHEGFLMIPTEPLKYPENDPGPHTLLTGAPLRDNLKKLDWLLSQVSGYVGIINEMGSKFTTSEEDLLPILEDLKKRGLMLLDSRSSRFSIAAKLARRISMPRAVNNLYLDNIISASAIGQNLTKLENTAHTYGAAIGVARAVPLTITEIEKWSRRLEEHGFHLVPVTAIANRQPVR